MELVVLATFAFGALLLVAGGMLLAIHILSRSLGEAHRKLMARDVSELARADLAKTVSEEWVAPTPAQAPEEARAFDPVAAWYGENQGGRF